jgi:PAS domain S-box-containing protein
VTEHLIRNYSLGALDDIPVLVKSSDSYGDCVYVNKCWQDYTGKYTSEEKGRGWLSNVHPEDIKDYSDNLNKAIKEQSEFSIELRLKNKNGEYFWFRDLGKPLLNDLGKYVGYISVFTDITKEKTQLDEWSDLLKRKEKAIREIIHRVRNNMAVISGMFDLHIDYMENPKDRAVLQSFQHRVVAMILIHENFYQSSISSKINFKNFVEDIAKRINNSYKDKFNIITVEITAEETEIELEKTIPCGLILNELIINSYKHAFQESSATSRKGRISICLSKESEKYTLTVSDNGKGITDETLINMPKTLGYTLIHALTKQLNGTINTTNKEGLLTKITF